MKIVIKIKIFSYFLLLECNASSVRGPYRSWNRINMQKAVKVVEEGMLVRKVAEKFTVR